MSNLVNAFLATVGKKQSQIVEIKDVGSVGVLTSLTMKQRAEYFNERKELEIESEWLFVAKNSDGSFEQLKDYLVSMFPDKSKYELD